MDSRLYIIMREDLYDNSPGKMMAQAAHAQAEFDAYAENNYTDDAFRSAHIAWCEDRNFGVTLVLHAPQSEWSNIPLKYFGIVEDPTYPYRNYYGKVFTSSEITCAWVFATTEEEVEFMKEWKLHQ